MTKFSEFTVVNVLQLIDRITLLDASASEDAAIEFGDLVTQILAHGVSAEIASAIASEQARADTYVDSPFNLNAHAGAYTIGTDATDWDANALIEATGNGGGAQTFTIPIDANLNATAQNGLAFTISVIGDNGVNVVGVSPVVINGTNTALAQGDSRTYYRRGANIWWGMSG